MIRCLVCGLIADLALRGRGSNVPKPVIRTGSPSQIVLVSLRHALDFPTRFYDRVSISSALFIVTS
jgi:hypothetical protein